MKTEPLTTDASARRPRPYTSSRPPAPAQRLLSLQQVQQEYGLPPQSIRDLVYHGKLPRVLLATGRRWWFDRRDLERYIERNKMTGADPVW